MNINWLTSLKIVAVLNCIIHLQSCSEDDSMATSTTTGDDCVLLAGTFPQYIEMPPVGDNGAYDPTLASDPLTGKVWMVFSRVDGAGGEGKVSSHLAYSDDNGTTWCYENEINSTITVNLGTLPDEFSSAISAHWSHEVPSLAYHPGAPETDQWVMTWHRYLHVDDGEGGNDDRQFAYGWIGMKTASDPTLLADAEEKKLFSAKGYYKTSATQNYNDAIIGPPAVRLDALNTALSGGQVFTETGMQYYQNELFVSLLMGNTSNGNSVVLIKTRDLMNWTYVSTILTPQDAQQINTNWTGFSATDLFLLEDQPYLLVSPVAQLYEGLLLFKLNLPVGTLVDNDSNGPDIFWTLPKTTGSTIFQTGVGTYDPLSFNTGIIYGDAISVEPQFRMYASGFIPDN